MSISTTNVGALGADIHEFQIVNDKALMLTYVARPYDLSEYGTRHGWILDNVITETDILSGKCSSMRWNDIPGGD